MSQKNNYPLYVKWMDIVPWIMARTERFPKNLRYSLAQKIDNICLEILELIVQAIYSQAKREPLPERDRKNRTCIYTRENMRRGLVPKHTQPDGIHWLCK